MGWEEQDPNVVASRYDRIASIYGLLAWFRLVPFGSIRKRAIEALALSAGDSVLEIGCGSGQNFAGLVGRIGSSGSLLGVDISQRMLIRAQKLCHRRGWRNVSLTRSGATAYGYENRVRAVLFSFSYAAMGDRRVALERSWECLEPGGRLVIAERCVSDGFFGRLRLPFARWLSRWTLLARPDTQPWDDLAALAPAVSRRDVGFAGMRFVISVATKSA